MNRELVPDSEQKSEIPRIDPQTQYAGIAGVGMLPSFEFIWKVFVSLFAIAVGILALYWLCASTLYLIALAFETKLAWVEKRGRTARTDAITKASIGMLVLIFLGAVFWARH